MLDILKALEDNLGRLLSLYGDIILYNEELMDMLNNHATDLDGLSDYLDRKDDLTAKLDSLNEESSVLREKLSASKPDEKLYAEQYKVIRDILSKVASKEKEAIQSENLAQERMKSYMLARRSDIQQSRRNAGKARRYMENMTNISMAADTVIDTSKKI